MFGKSESNQIISFLHLYGLGTTVLEIDSIVDLMDWANRNRWFLNRPVFHKKKKIKILEMRKKH